MADTDENVVAPTDEEISEAKALGWADKDSWRGKPEHWVDAKQFLEKGRPVMGVLQQQNSELRSEVASLRAAVQGANAAIEAIEADREADVKEQVEAARLKLKEELVTASREGRHEDVADLTEKMTQLNDAAPDGKDKKKEQPKGPQIHPEVTQWLMKNQDFAADERRMALAQVEAQALRREGDTTIGTLFMDKVAARVDKVLGRRGNGTSKVEGGNGGGGRSESTRGAGKSYGDLPQEAKAACERQAARLVGPSRRHKTIESWRESYVAQYFREE